MIDKYFNKFLAHLLQNPRIEDGELLEYLIKENVPEDIAFDIVIFIPVAFCRKFFSKEEIKFSDCYNVYQNGDYKTFKFSDNNIFNEASKFYDFYILNNVSKSDLISIVGRCAEFDAIVQAMEDEAEFKNLVLEPMRFYY